MSRNPFCKVFGLGLPVARLLSQMERSCPCGAPLEVASDDDQEKSLEAALRKANSRRAKVGLCLSDWNNRITALAFVCLFYLHSGNGRSLGRPKGSEQYQQCCIYRVHKTVDNADRYKTIRPHFGQRDRCWIAGRVRSQERGPRQRKTCPSLPSCLSGTSNCRRPGHDECCKEGQTGSWVIPGPPVFPDQTREIGVDPLVTADRVWGARAARIKSTYDNRLAFGGNPERAKEWADAIAKFPFYAPLSLVGCINYRSPDDRVLYQTSFIYDVDIQGTTFPLLSEKSPVSLPPTPMPNDPGGVVVHPREVQRIVPGEKVKLKPMLYGVFAH